MRYVGRLINGVVVLQALLIVTACFNAGQSSAGVAKIDKAQLIDDARTGNIESGERSEPLVEPTDEPEILGVVAENENLSDEEITTRFTTCMRDHGFNIPDPVLNADGTVDQSALRQSIAEDPKFDFQSAETRTAFQDCLPLLQGATFARGISREDEIELQDNLLEFAQCLRDNDIDVPDPDFSDGVRSSMGSVFQAIGRLNDSQREIVDLCREQALSGRDGSQGRPGGRPGGRSGGGNGGR